MTTTLAVPGTLPPVVDSQPFEAWKEEGQDLFLRLQATEADHELSQWDIGDWLHKGVKGKSKAQQAHAYGAAECITGWERETLYNIVSVVTRFPTPSLRSGTTLKWSHFKELARITDEAKRLQVLNEFSDNHAHSVQDVRTRVDTIVRELNREKREKNEKTGEDPKVSLRVKLSENHWNSLRVLAEAEGKVPDDYLASIIKSHLENQSIAAKLRKLLGAAKRTGSK